MHSSIHRSGRQRGVVLFISLIVLVAMTIAGLALMRASGSGVLIAGNLGFKRAATSAGDLGIELGRKWLADRTKAGDPLTASDAANGYLAGWAEGFDPNTHDWETASGPVVGGKRGATDAHHNDVRYVIHRLCAGDGSATSERCVQAPGGSNVSSGRSITYLDPIFNSTGQYAYRVTARVVGARGNTVSYTQAVIFN